MAPTGVAGLGAYWIYQHIGNLPPGERASDPPLSALRQADGDGGELLDEFVARGYDEPTTNQWGYAATSATPWPPSISTAGVIAGDRSDPLVSEGLVIEGAPGGDRRDAKG